MGKTSAVNVAYPSYTSGTVSLNGEQKASVSKIKNEVNANYNMNDYEKQIYNYAQSSLADLIPQLNVFNDSTQRDIRSQVNAYKQNAIDSLESMYKPMLTTLKNDIASRFGNLDNSMFMDNLGSLEDYRSKALSQLSQDVTSYQSDLYNNELTNRYNYLSLLNSLVSGTNNNALNYISNANANSSYGNSYNASNYSRALSNANNSNNIASILSVLGSGLNSNTLGIASMLGIL